MNTKLSAITLAAAMLAVSATSCINDGGVISDINTKEIISEVKTKLQEEVNRMEVNLSDTISMQTDSTATAVAKNSTVTSRVPVVIEQVTVKVSNNDQVLRNKRDQRRYMMGIMAMLSICVMSIIIVTSVLIFFYARLRNRNRLIEKAIENNYPLPDSFYAPNQFKDDTPSIPAEPIIDPVTGMPLPPPVQRDSNLLEGALKHIGAGLAVAIVFTVWNWDYLAVLGIIPIFIGIGKFISYLSSNK